MAFATNKGVRYLFELGLGKRPYGSLVVRLFTNLIAPDFTTVTTDLTECVLPGYAPYSLIPANWSESELAGLETGAYPTITFTFGVNSGVTTIYGFFITDQSTGWTVFIGVRNQPYPVPIDGGALTLNLTGLLRSIPT